MVVEDIKKLVHTWQREFSILGENKGINYVLIF